MEENDKKNTDEVSADRNKKWQFRRTVVVMSLIFCATVITFLVLYGEDTRLNETIAMGTFILAGSVIGSSVFGAVWDDKNVKDFKR